MQYIIYNIIYNIIYDYIVIWIVMFEWNKIGQRTADGGGGTSGDVRGGMREMLHSERPSILAFHPHSGITC
jgi:hypothetical protein